MKIRLLTTILAFCLLPYVSYAQEQIDSLAVDSSAVAETAETEAFPLPEFELSHDGDALKFEAGTQSGKAILEINNQRREVQLENGFGKLPFPTDRKGALLLIQSESVGPKLYHLSQRPGRPSRLVNIPLWLSLIPPMVAIALALIFKEVILSLFLGVWSGAFIAGGLRFDSFTYYFTSFWEVVEKYVIGALASTSHLAVIVFSLLIGGMVAVISRNGGMAGVVKWLSKYAKSPRSTQFITWLLGIAIFFDDYANTLIVGNTMRSVTDRFKISREKLAYIVDSTAAPVSAIAFITTWIGAELGYIGDSIVLLENFPGGTPYAIFLASLKYSFYPFLTLCFILILVYTGRDFGPMFAAEKRARYTGQVSPTNSVLEEELSDDELQPVKGAPLHWYNAFFPVLTVILMTMVGLLVTGFEATYASLLSDGVAINTLAWGEIWSNLDPDSSFFMKMGIIIGNADSYTALIWASLSGMVLAIIMTMAGRIMRLIDTMNSVVTGFKTMLPALIILTLAWSLAITTEELYTANFLSSTLGESLSPYIVPSIVFVLAALISFSTGSSWSTMAILYPLAIPTTWIICQNQGIPMDVSLEILYNVIAVVLAASVLGDHCSPISDTTILSSLASDCNHIDHVRTQLPYALLVGVFSLASGTIASYLGGGVLVCFLLSLSSLVLLTLIVLRFGKKV